MNKITEYIFKDAKWYEFWLPSSGAIGGLIAGLVILIIIGLLIA